MPTVNCALCGASYEVAPELAGKTIRCRECNELNRVFDHKVAAPQLYTPAKPGLEWLTSDNVWGVVGLLVGGFAILVILVGFIQHMTKPDPTPEQLEQQSIRREAKERLDKETDDLLRLGRELQIRDEMERQRKKQGF